MKFNVSVLCHRPTSVIGRFIVDSRRYTSDRDHSEYEDLTDDSPVNNNGKHIAFPWFNSSPPYLDDFLVKRNNRMFVRHVIHSYVI